MPANPKIEEEIRKKLEKGEETTVGNIFEKKVKVEFIKKPLDEREEEFLPSLVTHTALDKVLGEGKLKAGKLIEIYGEFATGKTEICFTLAVEAEGEVYYIDAEGTWSPQRVKEIAKARGKDVEKVNEKITLIQPDKYYEQLAIPYQMPSKLDLDKAGRKISLIVIDSLFALFRPERQFRGRQHLQFRQGEILEHLQNWKNLAKEYGAVVLYTNQVYDKPVALFTAASWVNQTGVGGHTIRHKGDFIIFLRKVGLTNARIARLVDSNETPLCEVPFVINERGIDDIPEDAEIMKGGRGKAGLKNKVDSYTEKQKVEEKIKKETKKGKTAEEVLEEEANNVLSEEDGVSSD